MSKQSQKGGDESTNIQAENITINQGISASEARQFALEVFQDNFYKLAGQAQLTARQRAEEITEDFLNKLQEKNHAGIQKSQDPDFQYSLFTVQKEYARIGDKELGALLVDLLIDRSKQDNRSILQIVLNESLSVAPKLTIDQLAALSVIFLIRHTKFQSIKGLDTLKSRYERYLKPYVNLLSDKDSCYQHLEYAGCGSSGLMTAEIPNVFLQHYPGLFSKGFEYNRLIEQGIDLPQDSPLITNCLQDNDKIQFNAINEDDLKETAISQKCAEGDINNMINYSKKFLMNKNEVSEYLKSALPFMKSFINIWDNSAINNFTLTSVGMAIGHANIKKTLGDFTELSIWIN